MIWSIYGWALLALSIIGLIRDLARTKPRKVYSNDEELALQIASFAIMMPLIGHLVGWW